MCDEPYSSITKPRKEWRKLVKKLRRKKIRQKLAKERDSTLYLQNSISIQQNEDDKDEDEQENKLRHEQWLKDEDVAQKNWQAREDARKKQEYDKKVIQEKIRKEWDDARAKKLEKQKEEERQQLEVLQKINEFISGAGKVPPELLLFNESNPTKELCPFFSKVSACRFGPSCSRNHRIPGISRIILISNFYTHFTLNQSRAAEYDTDVGLEFDEPEMLRHFKEFFDDVVSELKKYGTIVVIQACKNSEPHLRGNVYVEYKEERCALNAARSLNARWYGGRQLTVNLVSVPDWGAAICGDFHRGRCPKGNECNFLHTFRNPMGCYIPKRKESEQSSRAWRWSESPERIDIHLERRRSRHRSRDSRKSHRDKKYYKRSRNDDYGYDERRRSNSRKENKSARFKPHRKSTSPNTSHLSPHNSS